MVRGIFIVTAIVVAIAVVAIVSATAGYWFANTNRGNIAAAPEIVVVQVTPLPTYTPYPTATPAPTYTPYPTATPAPTHTPQPTAAPPPTYTPYPTTTPTQARPTYTPRPHPTATPANATVLSNVHSTENTLWLDYQHPTLAQGIANLRWAKDGLTDSERTLIDQILYIAVQDATVAHETIAQPFLQHSFETHDLHLVSAVYDLLYDDGVDNLRNTEIWQNRRVTDEWAPVVAAVAATASDDAHREYLDENRSTIENHKTPTALNPNLRISVIRKENDAARSDTVSIIQEAIDGVETVMGAPLPTDHVIAIFDERAVTEGYSGINHGFVIASTRETEDRSRERRFSHFAHEAAHYWWYGNEDWLDEGLAETIAATASLANGYNTAAQPNKRRDCVASNLSEIGDSDQTTAQFYCNYYLGEKLFRALQDTMSATEFREGLQEIYATSQRKHKELRYYRAGIIEVRRAFNQHSTIVNRYWNGDINTPETRDPDDQLNFTTHNAVRWTEKPTYRNGVVSFSGTLAGDATLVTKTISEAQQFGVYANFSIHRDDGEFLGSVLPPLTDGSYWNLTEPADVVAPTYEIHEKTFTIVFHWPDSAGDFRDKHITVWGYNNPERTPTVNDSVDPLGQSTIR